MKSLLLFSIFMLLSIRTIASGCDWRADGSPYIDRIETKTEFEVPASEIRIGCLALNNSYCLIQLMIVGDPNTYRKGISSGGDYQFYFEATPVADFIELKQAREMDMLSAKMIWENVYGSFDDNCAGPYPPLQSGRYHLQLTHKESKKTWDYYFINWLQPNRMLPLF